MSKTISCAGRLDGAGPDENHRNSNWAALRKQTVRRAMGPCSRNTVPCGNRIAAGARAAFASKGEGALCSAADYRPVTALLSRDCRTCRRHARTIAGELIIATALERSGIAPEADTIIEKLAFVHAHRRADDRIDGRGITKEVTMRQVGRSAVRHLNSVSDAAQDIPREERVGYKAKGIGGKINAVGVALDGYVARLDDGHLSADTRSCINCRVDVREIGFMNEQRARGGNTHVDASSPLILDVAIVNHQALGFDVVDPMDPCRGRRLTCALNIQAAENNHRISGVSAVNRINGNARNAAVQNRAEPGAVGAIDRHCLGNRYCAETARIEGIDLAALGGLGDCPGERLAGSGAAAWIRVVTDARYPGAGSLAKRGRRKADSQRNAAEESNDSGFIHVSRGGSFRVYLSG
jgi:hypothetical protein